MATLKTLIDAMERRRKELEAAEPRVRWEGGVPWPWPYRPSKRFWRRRGGWGRTGHRGALARALQAMCEYMDDNSMNAVMAELHDDAEGLENVIADIREQSGLDFRAIEVTATHVRYAVGNREKKPIKLSSLETKLSKARKEAAGVPTS